MYPRLFITGFSRIICKSFDDILSYNRDYLHILGIWRLFWIIFDQFQLIINKKKCTFGQLELEYIGHIIYFEGVQTDSSSIERVKS